MKKLTTFLLLVLTISSFGQKNILDIGFEGGLSLASLRGNEFINQYQNSRKGYSGGLFVQYNFEKLFSLRTGGYYEKKGSSSEIQATDEFGNPSFIIHEKQNYDYLTFPLLFRVSFGNKFNYFLNAGPFISILLKQSVHWEEIPGNYGDNTSNFNNTDAGISFGMGLSYTIKQIIAIDFEVRNNLGLTDVNADHFYNGGTINTNALYGLLGISFKIGKRKTVEIK